MLNRIKALATVGRYLGIDEMIKQISKDEAREMYEYTKRYFLNTHGVSQSMENKAWGYRQEATEIGYEYVRAIHEYCRERR